MNNILFSGVHGVGKGFFINKNMNLLKEYNICSASKLIEKHKNPTDAGYKRVLNVVSNQCVLIESIKEIMESDGRKIFLDGHLCIFDSKGKVTRIPRTFFEETNIGNILLLQDSPINILKRLDQRDNKKICINDIEKVQNEEEKYARELQEELGIQYFLIRHEDKESELIKILENLK